MKDTICAISTPPGIGAIAIVRVSGADALSIFYKLTRSKTPPESRRVYLKSFYDVNGGLIDRGLAIFFKAPESYTGEDIVEFHTHGGFIVPHLVLSTLLAFGARAAEPGEFTKRAFLNGKMDLLQAESVNEIINARTGLMFKKALSKLKGHLSKEFEPVLSLIRRILMEIEARIEFEEDTGPIDENKIVLWFDELLSVLNSILDRAVKGMFLDRGVKIVIYGPVNVGKSTIFNRLLGEERAIVTPYAGTTRDLVHEEVDIKGIPVRFIDTAGMRDTEDPVEKIGVSKAKDALLVADIIMFVVDIHTTSYEKMLEELQKIGVPIIKVLNKIDIANSMDNRGDFIPISARTGVGFDRLVGMLEHTVATKFYSEDAIVLKAREISIIESAIKEIKKASLLFSEGIEELELVSFHLNEAYKKQFEILGFRDMPDEVLDDIFKGFCIGK